MSSVFFGKPNEMHCTPPSRERGAGYAFPAASSRFAMTTGADGQWTCAVQAPFFVNMITRRVGPDGAVLTQTGLGFGGYRTLQSEIKAENESVIPMHRHGYYEMMYVMDGEVGQQIDRETYRFAAGHACLLNKNVRHSEVLAGDCTLIYLCFSDEYVRELCDNNSIKRKARILYAFVMDNLDGSAASLQDYLLFTPVNTQSQHRISLQSVIGQLLSELTVKQPGQRLMVNALLVRLIAHFLDFPEYYRCDHVVLDTKSDVFLFNRIARYIEEFHGKPTRAQLSEQFNYSADYINRVVKKNSGMSLVNYMQQVLIRKAEYALRHTDKDIHRIVHELGLDNQSHFYALFRRKHGMTPKQYRAMYR